MAGRYYKHVRMEAEKLPHAYSEKASKLEGLRDYDGECMKRSAENFPKPPYRDAMGKEYKQPHNGISHAARRALPNPYKK